MDAVSADGVVLSPKSIDFEKLLSTEFQDLDNLLAKSAFAAYLLGYDTANEENFAKISQISNFKSQINFAEGDDEPSTAIVKKGEKNKLTKRRKRALIRKGDTRGAAVSYLPHGKDQVAAEIGIVGKKPLASLRFDVPPQEAIDFFKRKKALPADEFYKLEAQARIGSFAIANVYKTDVTTALQNELITALENGTPQREVIARLKSILAGAGHKMLGNDHLETVFRTTMQMSYGVGRRLAHEEVIADLPIWEYSAVGDDRTRKSHLAHDDVQYPANHPFWDKYYPPWDFRCRCTVIATFDYRAGYDRTRPNNRTVISYDRDGMPAGYNVDGTPGNFKAPKFESVPSRANLEQVLKGAAERALDSRKPKS